VGSLVIVNRPEWSSVGTKERAQAGQDARRPRSRTSISGLEEKMKIEEREREKKIEIEKVNGRKNDGSTEIIEHVQRV